MTREQVKAMVTEARDRRRRDFMLNVRLTVDERAMLQAAAKHESVPPSTLARILLVTGLRDLVGLAPKGKQTARAKR